MWSRVLSPAKAATASLAVLITQSGCFTMGPRFLPSDWRPAALAFDVGIEVPIPTRDERGLVTTYSYALGHASDDGEPDIDFGIHEIAVGAFWAREKKTPFRLGRTYYPGRPRPFPTFKYAGVGAWVARGEYDAGARPEESWSAGVYAHCGWWGLFLDGLVGLEARLRVGAPFNFGGTSRSTASVGLYVVLLRERMLEGLLDWVLAP